MNLEQFAVAKKVITRLNKKKNPPRKMIKQLSLCVSERLHKLAMYFH